MSSMLRGLLVGFSMQKPSCGSLSEAQTVLADKAFQEDWELEGRHGGLLQPNAQQTNAKQARKRDDGAKK